MSHVQSTRKAAARFIGACASLLFLAVSLLGPLAGPALAAAPWPAIFAASAATHPAQKETVDVSLSSGYVKLGERVGIVIRVNSTGRAPGRLTDIKMSPVEGLTVERLQGPSEASRFQTDSRNRMVSSFTHSYLLPITPSAVGDYTISPLQIEIGGRSVTAPLKPMLLRVLKDIEGSRVIALDFKPLPKRIFEGEPYTVDMTLGWASSLNVGGVSLQVPWWGRQDGVVELTPALRGDEKKFPTEGSGQAELLVADLGEKERDGDTFQLYQLRRRFVATRAGKVAFSRTVLEVTRGSGRSRRTFYQVVPDFELEVVPVPEKGRPLDWTGAIGDIRVDRDVPRRDIDAGDTISFELSYSGTGNLEFFDPPNLERIPGFERFRVLGVSDEKQPFLRVITYELVPMGADVAQVPSVPLAVFDVETEAYRSVASEPVTIRVAAVDAGDDPFAGMADPSPEESFALAPLDIIARPVPGSGSESAAGLSNRGSSNGGFLSRGPGPWAGVLGLAAAAVGWVVLRRAVRRHGDPDSAAARRRRAAMGVLRRELGKASDESERTVALERFLGARTGTAPEAWIGRSSLAGTGVTDIHLDKALSELRDSLDRPVFGRSDGATSEAASGPGSASNSGSNAGAILEFAKRAIQGGL